MYSGKLIAVLIQLYYEYYNNIIISNPIARGAMDASCF